LDCINSKHSQIHMPCNQVLQKSANVYSNCFVFNWPTFQWG